MVIAGAIQGEPFLNNFGIDSLSDGYINRFWTPTMTHRSRTLQDTMVDEKAIADCTIRNKHRLLWKRREDVTNDEVKQMQKDVDKILEGEY